MTTRTLHYTGLRQNGFTLVEILVAITLSLILLAGVLQIFLSSKTTYTVQEGTSRLQENARFALNTLSQSVRMAGYPGCMYLGNVGIRNIASPAPSALLTSDTGINGINSVASGTTYGGVSAVAGTDVITVRETVRADTTLTAALATAAAPIVIASNPTKIVAGDTLVISDCNTADMFRVSGISGSGPYTIAHATTANTSASFQSAYNTNAQVLTYTSTTYFVGSTGRVNLQGNPINALYRLTMGSATADELVEGVENMKLQYGLDQNNDQTADTYVSATGVTATTWHNVVSVRLDLLVSSVDGVSPTPVSYKFNNSAAITPTDRILRREFVTVIALRNNTL